MNVKIEKDEMVIRVKLGEAKLSNSGNTMLLASETARKVATYKGKEVTVGLNVYYKP